MKLIGIEEHFLTSEIRDAWSAIGLDATDPSVAFHSGTIEGHLLDLAQDRLALMDETGLDVQTLPAPAGTDCCAARKALASPPHRRLVAGGDGAILLWTLNREKPRHNAPGPCGWSRGQRVGLHLVDVFRCVGVVHCLRYAFRLRVVLGLLHGRHPAAALGRPFGFAGNVALPELDRRVTCSRAYCPTASRIAAFGTCWK